MRDRLIAPGCRRRQGRGRHQQPVARSASTRPPIRGRVVPGGRSAAPGLRRRPDARPTKWTSPSAPSPRLGGERPDLDVHLDIYGRGDSEPALQARGRPLGLADRVAFHGRIPIDDVPAAVAAADIGVAPTRRDQFTDLSLSTKVYEYAAMGKPVVATRLPMVERTFPVGRSRPTRRPMTRSLADAHRALADDPLAREAAVAGTAAIVAEAAWEQASGRYLALVERLIGR